MSRGEIPSEVWGPRGLRTSSCGTYNPRHENPGRHLPTRRRPARGGGEAAPARTGEEATPKETISKEASSDGTVAAGGRVTGWRNVNCAIGTAYYEGKGEEVDEFVRRYGERLGQTITQNFEKDVAEAGPPPESKKADIETLEEALKATSATSRSTTRPRRKPSFTPERHRNSRQKAA